MHAMVFATKGAKATKDMMMLGLDPHPTGAVAGPPPARPRIVVGDRLPGV
jgi:hypothetical protein